MTEKPKDVDQAREQLPPDSQLYPLLMVNDDDAWSLFNKHYLLKLTNYFVIRKVSNQQDQKDLAQDTLIEFTRTLFHGRYSPDKGNLAQWLFAIAKNILLRHRKKYVEDYSKQSELRDDHLPKEDNDQVDDTFSQAIQEALSQLSPRIREVVLMRIKLDESVTWQDIADELDITESAASTRYSRGISQLKDILSS